MTTVHLNRRFKNILIFMAFSNYKELKHIPGERGNLITGNFLSFIKSATGLWTSLKDKYGDVFYYRILHRNHIALGGIDTNKKILVEEAKNTENKEAWETSLSDLFPNSLMLMDGAEHKYHRGIMLDAFKKEPMQGYLSIMPLIIQQELRGLKSKEENLMFPFFKMMTLKLATRVFFGLDESYDLERINNAISDMVAASTSIPINLPFTNFRKGINGRKHLEKLFSELVRERRLNPKEDLFSKFCIAISEEGDSYTDKEIVDHLIFVLMASHDTTAITLTWMSYFLAKHPEWQQIIREETKDVDTKGLQLSDFRPLEKLSLVLKETLRINPPLTMVVRKLTKAIEVHDHQLPENTLVSCIFQLSHNDERVWSDPQQFDPERFNRERKEHMKCPFAYAPFGAGPHHCIGYSFAEMQIKLVIIELLKTYELKVESNYIAQIQDVPLKQPKDNLPIFINRIK